MNAIRNSQGIHQANAQVATRVSAQISARVSSRGNTLKNNQGGFTLIELLVGALVGIIIIGGAFSLHVTTRDSQRNNEEQMNMVGNARFAIELITHDLRNAGMWGNNSRGGLIDCRSSEPACAPTINGDTPPSAMSGDCGVGWWYDVLNPVFATDGSAGNPYTATCIPASEGYQANTDLLEIKYADANEPIQLLGDKAYVRSNFDAGRIFVGAQQPKIARGDDKDYTTNHEMNAYVYYISDHTDAAGDGLPSLRRVSMVDSTQMQNQVIASGIVDLQVQFGEDLDGNGTVDRYVDPDSVGNWQEVYSAKVWLVLRSERQMDGVNTTRSFSIAGNTVSYGGANDYRYFVMSSTVSLRNLQLANTI